MNSTTATITSKTTTAFYDVMFPSTAIKINALEALALDLIKASLIDAENLHQKIRPLPQLQLKLLNLLSKDSAGYQDVATLIGQDPALSMKILQIVNSAQSNAGFQITNLETAVARLGMNGVASIASAIMMRSINPPKPIYYKLYGKQIWTHSLQCALLCKGFSVAMGEDEFMGHFLGLVHDVGKILVFENIVEAMTQTDLDFEIGSQEFRESITETSLDISYFVAREWGLPEELCIALQEQSATAKSPYAICLHTANECAELFLATEEISNEDLPLIIQKDEKFRDVWDQFLNEAGELDQLA